MTVPTGKGGGWMSLVLLLAGGYNLAWGTLVLLLPDAMYRLGGLADPPGQPLVNTPVWQCLGMVIGVYGLAYVLASRDPLRHWPVVLVGLVGKVLGPLGLLAGNLAGPLAWSGWWTCVFNDLIWWLPFALILLAARRRAIDDTDAPPGEPLPALLERATTPDGVSLLELSQRSPVLVVFLRHLG